MGTDYEPYCRTCGCADENAPRARFWIIASILEHAAAIAVAAPALRALEDAGFPLRSDYWGHVPYAWLAAHAGHDLAARSDMGEVEDCPDRQR